MTSEAGSSIGRFASMLGTEIVDKLRSLHKERTDDLLHAELVYWPGADRAANVCIRPNIHPYEIAFGAKGNRNTGQRITLDDIVVTLRNNRFTLWSVSFKRQIRVHESHLLNPSQGTPPAYLLLSAVARGGKVLLAPFNWGPLSLFPALPRLKVGRVVVSLARWNVPISQLRVPRSQLPSAVQAWRERWNVPEVVLYAHYDNRLPICLSTDHGLDVLSDTDNPSGFATGVIQALAVNNVRGTGGEDAYIPVAQSESPRLGVGFKHCSRRVLAVGQRFLLSSTTAEARA